MTNVHIKILYCHLMENSPRTVSITLTSTEPRRFLATHSYSAVSSFCALLIRSEPLIKLEKRSLASRGRPCFDHSIIGVGSPSAWQLSRTVVPASTTVSAGSTVMVGAPGRRRRRREEFNLIILKEGKSLHNKCLCFITDSVRSVWRFFPPHRHHLLLHTCSFLHLHPVWNSSRIVIHKMLLI